MNRLPPGFYNVGAMKVPSKQRAKYASAAVGRGIAPPIDCEKTQERSVFRGTQTNKGAETMRRMMLAVSGAVAGGMLLLIFFCAIACQWMTARAAEQPGVFSFPCRIPDTELTALQLARYQGPFWEDRSGNATVDAAALLVENTGDLLVAEGAVVLEFDHETLVFEIAALPPGEQVLVLEKDAQKYPDVLPVACYGWDRTEYPEDMGRVTVEPAGTGAMTVVNHSGGSLPVVRITFKNRDPGSGVFIGGIAYTVEVRDLQPGERRMITHECYTLNSTVVQVTVFTEA